MGSFISGILLGITLPAAAAFVAAAIIFFISLILFIKFKKVFFIFITVFAGAGVLRGEIFAGSIADTQNELCGKKVALYGKVSAMTKTEYGYSLILKRSKGSDIQVLCDTKIPNGTFVSALGEAEKFSNAENPGEFDAEKYYTSLGVACRIKKAEVTIVKDPGLMDRIINLVRDKLSNSIISISDEESAPVLTAVFTGDKENLTPKIKQLYSDCGIGHILAISGLHISLIGLAIFKMLRFLGASKKISSAVSIIIMLFYVCMTGMSPSAVRAFIMYALLLLAGIGKRSYDSVTAALTAAAVLVLINPMYLYNSGFQLSFLAILGTIFYAVIDKGFMLKKKAVKALTANLCINLTTMPVIMYNYYQLPLLSLPINLCVIPLMSLVLFLTSTGALTGLISVFAGKVIIMPADFLVKGFTYICNLYKELDFGFLVTGKPSIPQMFIYYLILIAIVYIYARCEKKTVLATAVLSGAALFIRPKSSEIIFLYAGQGNMAYIRTPQGENILIDCGSTRNDRLYEDTIKPFLHSKAVTKIDAAFVTHCDTDHMAGFSDILKNGEISIEKLFLPQKKAAEDNYKNLEGLAVANGVELYEEYAGVTYESRGFILQCIYPDTKEAVKEINDFSTVMVVELAGEKILFPGDISEKKEKQVADLAKQYAPFDIVLAPHHGSKNSNSEYFFKTLAPKETIISCGKNNSFGHPHSEALERIRKYSGIIKRTDEEGAIIK